MLSLHRNFTTQLPMMNIIQVRFADLPKVVLCGAVGVRGVVSVRLQLGVEQLESA